jgi:hypothetical protein
MRARADRIGAQFACTSRPGNGTTIEVTVDAAALDALRGAAAAADDAAARSARSSDASSIRDG